MILAIELSVDNTFNDNLCWPVCWQPVPKSFSWMNSRDFSLGPLSAGKIETLYGLKNKYTMLLRFTRSMQQASRISDKTGFS